MIDKIKPAEERIHPMALDDKSVWCNAYFDEVVELRAAYEALQKENAAQAKRIAELEEQNLDYWNRLVKLSALKNGE